MIFNIKKPKTEKFWWKTFYFAAPISLLAAITALMMIEAKVSPWMIFMTIFVMIASGVCAEHAQRKAGRIQSES